MQQALHDHAARVAADQQYAETSRSADRTRLRPVVRFVGWLITLAIVTLNAVLIVGVFADF